MNKYKLYIENHKHIKENHEKFSDIYEIMNKIQPATLNVEVYRKDLELTMFKGKLGNILIQIRNMKKYMKG